MAKTTVIGPIKSTRKAGAKSTGKPAAKPANRKLRTSDGVAAEEWRVFFSTGRSKTVVTSPSSASVMNDAMVVYNRALKRLAGR